MSLEQVAGQFMTDDPDLQRTLLKELAQRPEWPAEAAALVEKWLADPIIAESREQELAGLVQTFGRRPAIQQRVAEILAGPKSERGLRLLLLRIVARLGSGIPTPWLTAIGQSLADRDATIVHEALIAARACELRKFDRQIQALGGESDLPARVRVAALACSIASTGQVDRASFVFLAEQLVQADDPLLALDAARTLGGSRLNAEQLEKLGATLAEVPATAGLLVLPAFKKSRDPAAGPALVAALEQAPVLEMLTVGELDRLLADYPSDVRDTAAALRERLLERERAAADALAKVAAELLPGDPDKGREVFFSDKAACSTCHGVGGQGGGLGPSLSRVAFIRSRADLLESIVRPSALVDAEFRSWIVLSDSGEVFTGLMAQETAEAMYLRPAPQARDRIPLAEIEDIRISDRSLMPEGLEKVLSRQELSDLLEFLSRLQ